MVGASDRAAGGLGADETPRWRMDEQKAIDPNYRAAMALIVPDHFVSHGHGGTRFSARVFANLSAAEWLEKGQGPAPVGARFVKEHFERGRANHTEGPVMMMEKKPEGFDPSGGDWRYVVVDPTRGSAEIDGPDKACKACHDLAPSDHLFPLPLAKYPSLRAAPPKPP